MDFNSLPPTVTVPILCAAGAVFVYWLGKPRVTPGIPHPPYKWLFGHVPDLIAAEKSGLTPTMLFNEYALKYGPVTQFTAGPTSNLVLISDPQEVDDILRRRGSEFGHSDNNAVGFGYTVPKGQISLPDGSMWRSHRRLMGPSMSNQYLRLMTPRISTNIEKLVELWGAKHALLQVHGGAAFEAAPDIQLFTMDNIGDITFAETFGGTDAALHLVKNLPVAPRVDDRQSVTFEFPQIPHHLAVRRLFKMMGDALTSPSPRLAYYFYGFWTSSWRAARRQVHTLLQRRIDDQRRAVAFRKATGDTSESADSVLEMIFEREGKDSPETMPDDELIDELALFLLAGQDTTAASLSWAVKFFTRYPEVQKKLHADLVRAFDVTEPRVLTFEEVQNRTAPYLDAVVAEILRLAHVAPVVGRETTRDTHVLNYFLPKGTQVLLLIGYVNIHDTASNAEKAAAANHSGFQDMKREIPPWNDDGQEFVPERWLDAEGNFNPKAGTSHAFSAGPRQCFGQRLALLQIKLTLSALNLAFFFDKLPYPEMEGWEAVEAVVRQPRKSWIMLKRWDAVL